MSIMMNKEKKHKTDHHVIGNGWGWNTALVGNWAEL